MKKWSVWLAVLVLGMPAARAGEGRLLRFPATDGERIVFSYAGDLYTVPAEGGKARRLTSHVGYEMFPRYSPDGRTIAFTGQYDGNTEVYSIPAEGGEPLRLTYTATLDRDDIGDRMGPNNIVMAWTPDGKQVVYRSRKQTSGFVGRLFKVGAEGGLSEVIPLPEGGFCSYSASSAPGNIIKAAWPTISGFTTQRPAVSRTSRRTTPRISPRCGSATRSSSFRTATGR